MEQENAQAEIQGGPETERTNRRQAWPWYLQGGRAKHCDVNMANGGGAGADDSMLFGGVFAQDSVTKLRSRRRKTTGCWGLSRFSWSFLLLALMQAIIIIGLQIAIAVLGKFRADQLEEYTDCLESSLRETLGMPNITISNTSSIPAFGRDKEIYVYFFMALALYNLALCIYALKAQNIIEIFTFLIINILAMVYACVQVYQFRGFGSECPTITTVGYLALANSLLLLVLTCIFAVLSFFIYIEFGWKIYTQVNCHPILRYYYRVYEVFMSGVKLLILFMLIFFIGQIILLLGRNYETGLTILLCLVAICAFPFTYIVVRRESRIAAVVLVIMDILIITYCVFKIARYITRTCPLCRVAHEMSEKTIEVLKNETNLGQHSDVDFLYRAQEFEHLVMIGVMNLITALVVLVIFLYFCWHYGRGLKEYFSSQPHPLCFSRCFKPSKPSAGDSVEGGGGGGLVLSLQSSLSFKLPPPTDEDGMTTEGHVTHV